MTSQLQQGTNRPRLFSSYLACEPLNSILVFSSIKLIGRISQKCQGLPWTSSVAPSFGSQIAGSLGCRITSQFEDNGGRFGLDYTRQGYFT